MLKINIGIDPGASGAIAIRRLEDNQVNWKTFRIPMIDGAPWKSKRRVDDRKLFDILEKARGRSRLNIAIEKQYAQGKQGVVSGGTTMFNYATLITVASRFCRPRCVRAIEWQRIMLGPATGNTKERSISACMKLYPNLSLLPSARCKKASDGIADAVLIAEYCATYKEMKGRT